jgi:hypothetical protein
MLISKYPKGKEEDVEIEKQDQVFREKTYVDERKHR